jgi:hypothetical protein
LLLCHFTVDQLHTSPLIAKNSANYHHYLQSQTGVPPPLQIPPSRARRQFAIRLAQRKAQLESTREQQVDPEDHDPGKTQEQEEREGHQRFARMFEGIDDSSDDESLNSYEGAVDEEEEVVSSFEVEGKEVGQREDAGDAMGKTKESLEKEDEGEKKGETSQTIDL